MNLPKFTKKAEARAWYEQANPTHSAIWVADMMNAYARAGMYKMYDWVQRWAIDNGINYDTAYIDGRSHMTLAEFHEYRSRVMNHGPEWTRFNHCQAWISDGYFGVKLVKSYATIVGVIKDDTLWWDQKYSRTTSKQITQIANRYNLNTAQVEDV